MAGKLERYFLSKNTSPEIIVIINCVLNAPQIFITIVGNTLVLVAVSRTPSIGSQSTIMLCSLAVWPSCPLDGATGLLRFLPNKNVCCSRGNKSHWLFCKRCLTPHYDSCSRGSLRSYPLSLAIPAIDDQKARRLSIGRPLDYHRLVIFFRRSW